MAPRGLGFSLAPLGLQFSLAPLGLELSLAPLRLDLALVELEFLLALVELDVLVAFLGCVRCCLFQLPGLSPGLIHQTLGYWRLSSRFCCQLGLMCRASHSSNRGSVWFRSENSSGSFRLIMVASLTELSCDVCPVSDGCFLRVSFMVMSPSVVSMSTTGSSVCGCGLLLLPLLILV